MVEWSNNGCLADDERGDKAGGVLLALGLLRSISSGSVCSPLPLRVGDAVGESTSAPPDAGGGVDGREPWARAFGEFSIEGDRTIDARICPPKLLRTWDIRDDFFSLGTGRSSAGTSGSGST